MSVLQDYANIRGLLDSAVENALRDNIADGLKKAIQNKALQRVYSYPATPSATARRRKTEDSGLVDDAMMITRVDGTTLTLENVSEPQNASGIDLTPIVEEGWGSWKQPLPRPFMDEALDEYVDSGAVDSDLARALKAVGFTVI